MGEVIECRLRNAAVLGGEGGGLTLRMGHHGLGLRQSALCEQFISCRRSGIHDASRSHSITYPSINGGTQPIGVLCRQIEQSTTDATGSEGASATTTGTDRIRSWTYDQYGQVLTADGPRTDINDVTTYTYHSATDPVLGKRGNVATITNALGHITQIPDYDANGRPLTIIDPNGISTTLTYDLRGRLTSKTTGGEATSYQYDGVGQLTQVTLPDSSYIAYIYDAAHRLTDVTDSLGNSIHYTLDAMGNRTKEEVKDPQGTLSRQTTRVYDALNRLQTSTGA